MNCSVLCILTPGFIFNKIYTIKFKNNIPVPQIVVADKNFDDGNLRKKAVSKDIILYLRCVLKVGIVP